MIKRSSESSKKKISTIDMKLSMDDTDISIRVSINSDRADEIRDYMIDKLGNESPLSKLWCRMCSTMNDIMVSDKAVQRAAPEVLEVLVRHILIEEFKNDIYEVASH